MKTVWLVRHGESTAQTGQSNEADPDLTQRGITQAHRLRDVLSSQCFDLILVSPLCRTRRTFEMARPNGKEVRFDARIVECPYGRNYGEILDLSLPRYATVDVPDAWIWSAEQRVVSVVRDIEEHRGKSFLIISHWAILSVMALHVLGQTNLAEPNPSNTKCCLMLDNGAIGILALSHTRYGNVVMRWNWQTHVEDILEPSIRLI